MCGSIYANSSQGLTLKHLLFWIFKWPNYILCEVNFVHLIHLLAILMLKNSRDFVCARQTFSKLDRLNVINICLTRTRGTFFMTHHEWDMDSLDLKTKKNCMTTKWFSLISEDIFIYKQIRITLKWRKKQRIFYLFNHFNMLVFRLSSFIRCVWSYAGFSWNHIRR